MSHEIRTPLTAIIGNNELLQFGGYDVIEAIAEINQQIIDCVKNDGKQDDTMKSLYDFCIDFRDLVFNSGLDMDDYYVEKVSNLLESGSTTAVSSIEDPLFPVRSYIQAVKDLQEEKDKKIVENVETSNRLGRFLINLIESILDIAKLEAGKILLSPAQVNIREFVENVYTDAMSYRKAKGKDKTVKMQHKIEPEVPEVVFIDRNKMKQVLLNIFSNAIKFTDNGKVTLHVTVKGTMLCFSISDTGIGIKEEDRNMLFKEFGRTSNSRTVEGTGLGLALSRMLVELHHGRIEVTSEYEKGSVFTVTIPVIDPGNRKR
jgi:signal transduction histidine kinase